MLHPVYLSKHTAKKSIMKPIAFIRTPNTLHLLNMTNKLIKKGQTSSNQVCDTLLCLSSSL